MPGELRGGGDEVAGQGDEHDPRRACRHVEDDLLIAQISVKDGDPTFATPTGWTLLFSGEAGGAGDIGVGVFYKVAGASEPANHTFTWSDSKESAGAMARYSNVDTTTPIDAWANGTGNDSNPLAPDVTTTSTDTMLIRLFGSTDDETVTSPTGTTGRYDISGNGATSAGADATQAAAGATGTATFTIGSNEKWVAATIALTQATQGATCYYVVEAYYQNWTSPSSNEAQATGC